MITKPSILITSIGRTGTEFFSRFYAALLPGCTSLHEPDIFQNTGVQNKYAHFLQQVRRAGIWRMVFLKAIGKWTLASLSDARFLRRQDRTWAIRSLRAQRGGFVERMPGAVYVEANIGYYGLLDILPDIFQQHRAIYVIRDGREWVRSHMNWGEAYGKRGLRKLISHNWPAASQLPADPYSAEWLSFSRFERLCWAWTSLNDYALAQLSANPHARLFRFEQIFFGQDKYRTLDELVKFTTSLPGITVEPENAQGWLEQRSHQGKSDFPGWEEWTADQKRQFRRICGPLMERLQYSLE